jgi:hypothetical protein
VRHHFGRLAVEGNETVCIDLRSMNPFEAPGMIQEEPTLQKLGTQHCCVLVNSNRSKSIVVSALRGERAAKLLTKDEVRRMRRDGLRRISLNYLILLQRG